MITRGHPVLVGFFWLTNTFPLPNVPDHLPLDTVMISLWTRASDRDSSGFNLTAMRKSNSRAGEGKSRSGFGKCSRERLESSSTLLEAIDGLWHGQQGFIQHNTQSK